MKRIILATVLLFTAFTVMASNGRDNDSTRYLSSTLRENWFVTVNGSINWWQGSDRIPAGNFTTLNGPSFGGGVSVGKWITHNLALRLSYEVNPGKSFINGGHDNLQSLQFLYVDKTQPIPVLQDGYLYQYYKTEFMYHNLHGDVMISPLDLIQRESRNRRFTPVLVAGMGLACVSEHVFVTQSLLRGESRNFELSFNGGLVNYFRLDRENHFNLTLTAMISGQQWKIDTWRYEYGGETDLIGPNGIRPRIADYNYSILLGITWNSTGTEELGSRYYIRGSFGNNDSLIERIHDLEEDIKELANINDSLMGNPIYVHDTVIQFVDGENKFVSIPFSVFFELDSYHLKSKGDWFNLEQIAKVAREHHLTIHLRGSADSATATPSYNQALSERRCNMVKGILTTQMGVPEAQIEIEPVGGVHELDPTKFDRRVIVTFVKDLNP